MQPEWSDGYVAEIGYTYGFYRELTPALIQYLLLDRGILPPALNGSYQYCELGFGQGLSTNLLAAANPRGAFWGTDFNPEQVAFAREISDKTRNNATLFDDDFETFVKRDTPPFDFIVLHGTWSWVSREAQTAIVNILRQKLKVGGAVYVSYNVLPGWSQEQPLRDLMMLYSNLGSANGVGISGKIDDAIDFADKLHSHGARFFSQNSKMSTFLSELKGDDRSYLAHEYFNRCWDLIYFSDMSRQLEKAKLAFACSAHQMDLLNVLDHRGGIGKFIQRIDNVVLREVATDFALNRRFRRDIFTRGARRLQPAERVQYLLDMRIQLQSPLQEIAMCPCGPEGEVPMPAELYEPLLEILGDHQPHPIREVVAEKRLRHANLQQFLNAIRVLISLRYVHPICPADEAQRKQAHTRRFNELITQQARFSNQFKYLASPSLTGGISTNRFQLLFLLARQQKLQGPEEWARFAWENSPAHEGQLKLEDRIIDNPEEGITEFRRRADNFAVHELPLLQHLGVA